MLALSDRHTEAEKLVGPIIDDAAADPGYRCESAEICGTAALFADDIETLESIAATWSDSIAKHSSMIHLVGLNQQALIALCRGSPEKARIVYSKIASNDLSPGRYTLGWRDWIIGFSYVWEGQVELAAKTLHGALTLAENEAGRRSPVAVMLAALLATAYWDGNQTDAAAALLADRLDVLERRTPPDAIALGYITATRLAVLANEEQRAFDLLDYLYALGSNRGIPRLCIAALGERIRLHAFRGRGDICAVVVRTLDGVIDSLGKHRLGLIEPVVRLQIGIAHVYSSISRHDWSGALEQLNRLAPEGEHLRRGREAMQIYLLRALAKKRCGDDGTALLEEAMSMSRMWGLKRILADTHPDLPDWARQLEAGKAAKAGLREHEVAPAQKAAPRARVANSSLLSPKEREVLQLLAGNMSNKQIALAMGVSDETIKWHLKNLFGKLNAGTRKHLLDRARIMGILDTYST
jgi:LuxR family maltose regulon positive regulatory protein